MKRTMPCLVISLMVFLLCGPAAADSGPVANRPGKTVRLAVEFMDHAAAAFVSREKGWFAEAGLKVQSYETYVTGMALASALSRGDIDAAYICLVPAINAFTNAGAPVRIIAGTHKHGYGLVSRGPAVQNIQDLRQPEVRLGCVREGGAVDVLLRKIMDVQGWEAGPILSRVQRMPPDKQVLALQTGQLDAAVLPEQWATMAAAGKGRMLLTSRDVWPRMQGSVLAAKADLLRDRPEVARKLVAVLVRATDWINRHPAEAAAIVAGQLQQIEGGSLGGVSTSCRSAITPDVLRRSMDRMAFTTDIDPAEVQKMIDYLAALGYIKSGFAAREILDLRYLKNGYHR
ncbi:MAG: ABC transporter substrate-binding protein [Desulfosudaceae bacterium]